MKKLIPIVALIFLWNGVSAQFRITPDVNNVVVASNNDLTSVSPVFRKSLPTVLRSSFRIPGERQKKFGMTMTLIGSAMIIGGIISYSDSDKIPEHIKYRNTNGDSVSYDQYDPRFTLGILMIAGGTGMTVPGILLWRKGVKKVDQYMKEQEKLSLGIRGNSAVLIYKF